MTVFWGSKSCKDENFTVKAFEHLSAADSVIRSVVNNMEKSFNKYIYAFITSVMM